MERLTRDTALSALEATRDLMVAAAERGDARAVRTYFAAIAQCTLDLLMRTVVPASERAVTARRVRQLVFALPKVPGLVSIRVKFDYAVPRIAQSVRTGRIDQRVIHPLESAATL